MSAKESEYLTSKEAAAEFPFTAGALATMRYLDKSRDVPEGPPYIQIRRKVLYRRSDICAWLDANTVTQGRVSA